MEVLGAYAPRRTRAIPKIESECLREAHAEMLTIGGVLMLAVCFLISVSAVIAWLMPNVGSLQIAIVSILALASGVYAIDCLSERLRLVDHSVEYGSLLGRRRLIPLEELEAMLLVYEGLNLERGIESIEFRRRGKKPERIALGPCWQRRKLESFLHSVEDALHDPQLLENVR
jgi:hypothetical protein